MSIWVNCFISMVLNNLYMDHRFFAQIFINKNEFNKTKRNKKQRYFSRELKKLYWIAQSASKFNEILSEHVCYKT